MKSRATLSLTEMLIMVMIFAMAAAACLKVFAWADARSAEIETTDFAVLQVSNAAEVMEQARGDYARAAALLEAEESAGGGLQIRYDENRERCADGGAFRLVVLPVNSVVELMGEAQVSMMKGDTVIYSLTVCWQEAAA